MGENKQVRVDNWGTFLLQKLQTFFNKTDYCDLTLQFDGNIQLKVHRLVMNACTDYFHILEQTCEMIDDVLMMPSDLTPDIILPIVNFMYTGMLEFQMSNYAKLYKAAELMDMPIITKILDAQKAKYPARGVKPRSLQQNWTPTHVRKNSPDLPQALPGRKLPIWKRKSVPVNTSPTISQQTSSVPSYFTETKLNTSEPIYMYDNTPKPTRFEWPEEELTNFPLLDTSSFDDISYTSKPILTQDEEMRSSTFDEVRHLPTLNKRATSYNAPQIDIEEVKNYVKEQKVRSELTDNCMEEEDVDNDFTEIDQHKRKLDKQGPRSQKRAKYNLSEKENITSTQASSGAKISATVSGDVNHTKIISEVLKKYPHLMKKNKNIRLKILAKSSNKTEPQVVTAAASTPKTTVTKSENSKKQPEEGPWICQQCSTQTEKVEFVLYYLYRKHMTDVHYEKFDSKQCKYCGHKSPGLATLMYHQYMKHETKPPSSYKFPKCKQCPYIALSEAMLAKHRANHTKHDAQCNECKIAFSNRNSLTSHIQITGHSGKSDRTNFDCQYCTKRLPTDTHLFAHIKLVHRDEASRDGVVGIDEMEADEMVEEDLEREAKTTASKKEQENNKIKIISNVKYSSEKPTIGASTTKTGDQKVAASTPKSSQGNSSSNQLKMGTATGTDVAASLGLVDIVVLDENQQYILQSNSQESSTEYILPGVQSNFNSQPNTSIAAQTMLATNSDIASTDELVMVLTDHDYNDGNNEMLSSDNSNIVVLYSHPVDGTQENQYLTTEGNLITSQGNIITTQGNLVLNSQTGMIEIRNPDNQMMGQEESIEMIQQEINSHKDYKTGTTFSSNQTAVESKVEHTPSEGQTLQAEEKKELSEDNVEKQEILEVQTENTPVEETVKTGEENVMATVTDSDETNNVPCPDDNVDAEQEEKGNDNNHETQEIEGTIEPIAVESERKSPDVIDTVSTNVEEANVENNEKCDGLMSEDTFDQPESEQVKGENACDQTESQDNEDGTKNVDDETDANDKSIDERLNETAMETIKESDSTVSDIEPETATSNNEEVVEQNKVEMPEHEENKEDAAEAMNVNEQEFKTEDESGNQEDETMKVEMSVEEAEVENADVIINPTENVNTDEENSKLSENVSTDVACESMDKEMLGVTKIDILHDWEDTDSQQSEHPDGTVKTENTVNKLMTDWEDEEEMKD